MPFTSTKPYSNPAKTPLLHGFIAHAVSVPASGVVAWYLPWGFSYGLNAINPGIPVDLAWGPEMEQLALLAWLLLGGILYPLVAFCICRAFARSRP
ncbi:hypothetical protein DB346_18900 [Verrucomicrobia bacterium LW23]|nr:hypothetical protein DB346_18900 [Verrucomicrobia bacterium LW23]